ncbi:MAG: putative collagen-binding domain-containing protein, partial [Blastocatellia bacterium]
LRSRIEAAGARGIYVSVMLFEGWSKHRMKDAFRTHPFHPANNVNGLNADTNGDGIGFETVALENPKVVAIQERYVSKVVDTINDLDNVLYEIANESHGNSTAWQYHMIEFVRKYEKRKPKQHPIGITFLYTGGSDEALFRSSADWISPSIEGGYLTDPPPNAGSKVILADTDHLGGLAGDQQWVWKSFLRGLNCIFMDPYDGAVLGLPFDPQWEPVRVNMGYVRRFANRLDLAAMRPRSELSSTRYCLTDAAPYLRRPGKEYLVYLPDGGGAQVDLSAAKGSLSVEWFNPSTGKTIVSDAVEGGRRVDFRAPFSGDAVLYLRAK